MRKVSGKLLKLSPVVLAATFFTANSALAGEVTENMTSVAQLEEQNNSLGQVTSVSQFSDVQPTDWAFQALQSLVERYGCIAGYPNGTYRGNRAMTRYEFAAGLNACLDRVNELIATATADLVRKEDLATLQRLQEEFSAELATLRGRVDALEARTAELEANQFSTTTKLVGEVIFNISEVFGNERAVPSGVTDPDNDGNPGNNANDDLETNPIFSDRVRLRLNTSFTGKDLLVTRLQARNTTPYGTNVTGTNMTRLSFDDNNNNDIEIDKLNYSFNLGEAVRIKIDASSGEFYDNINNLNPDLASDGRGAIGRYGRFSPIYRQGQGGAGATITLNPRGPITLSAGYLAGSASNIVTGTGSGASNPGLGRGIFNGSYAAIGQLSFQPNQALSIGLTYARTYQNSENGINLFSSTGSQYANNPFNGAALTANHYGVEAAFRLSKNITIGGWYGYSEAEAKSGPREGDDADFNYWAATLAFKDFGREGNLLGIIFGQPPKAGDNDFVQANGVRREDDDTSYHLEALYRLQLSNNIAITPGVLVIFNPEHNNDNDTIYVGTLRTTFTF
ncbi:MULTISPECIES: iron uptake porin [Nostocales]|uniref:Iron uptake porin n=3 Tax=Nostocales TaxID=1161 RepID=A0A0C1RG04_9CYAN|nr:iron uptake porin [Tolypothrix bouteillei]KAF3887117.1 iron uptake porin [Tolypothrix bouteillei VB521301]